MGGNKAIVKNLEEFKRNVSKKFPLKRVILFGSTAKGATHKDSDIDLIIVSKKFKGMNFFERGAKMYDYWSMRRPVDFLCYTPSEFDKFSKMLTIVREAAKEGIEIK